jgi:hypothetical protein
VAFAELILQVHETHTRAINCYGILPPPNFTEIGRQMLNIWVQFLSRPQVNKSFHCTDFHEDPKCSTALRTLPTHLAQIGKQA